PADIPDDSHRTGQEEIEVPDLAAFVQRLREHGGFCIAAHIDNDYGVRKLFRQTGRETLAWFNDSDGTNREQEQEISESFKQYLAKARFNGIEVRSPDDRRHYSWSTEPEPGTRHQVPVFLTFDSHSIEELSRPSRVNYVKMADVSLQGLVDAARFPDTRIRFSNERVPPPYMVGVEIISPDGSGFFKDVRLGFVENLNCIIGPRGSGKSTIVEALRYVFGYNRTLGQLESEDLVTAVKQRQERNLVNSILRVGYKVSDGEVHFLEATYDSQSDYATKVYDIDGNSLLVDDVERDGRYPLRLFGWSEIETLGNKPARQRDLLDKFVQDLPVKHDRKRSIRADMAANSRRLKAELDNLMEAMQGENAEIRRYREYSQQFAILNTPEVQDLFANLDQKRTQWSFMQKFKSALTDLSSRIGSVLPVDLDEIAGGEENAGLRFVEALDDTLVAMLGTDPSLASWWQSVSKCHLSLDEAQRRMVAHLQQTLEMADALSSRLAELAGETQIEIGSIESEIRRQVSADPNTQVLADLRDEAKKRLARVESLRVNYTDVLADVKDLLQQRQQMCGDLQLCHAQISDLRCAKKSEIEGQLNEFKTEEMVISLEFERDGDRDLFVEHLTEFSLLGVAHRQFRAKKWPALITAACTPCQFADCVINGDPKPLVGSAQIEGRTYTLESDDAETIVKALNPYGWDEESGVDTIDPEKLEAIAKIQEVAWDDRERILRNSQPVDTASPGQRSSAMLPLIALAESVPLLIDQPEDNLDNRLVGKVLVDILAQLKEKRQIIVATHNPNIVVLGDSEQVIVLEAVSDTEGKVEQPQASVDHPLIVQHIIELLEGGREAFETRRRRYFEV
ncbi:MAG: AAA family ATPase, partial [Anaerolineae bacterium]|nr:AAA family ATPase [Anaerolineae bacterium]